MESMEAFCESPMAVAMSLLSLLIFVIVYKIYGLLSPYHIKKMMERQGISGPPPLLLLGNILDMKKSIENAVYKMEDIAPHHLEARLFPFFLEWKKAYGKKFVYWLGSKPILYLQEPELIQQIISSGSLDRTRPSFLQKLLFPIFGNGLIMSEGEDWIHQRRVVGQALTTEKVKGMLALVAESTVPVLNEWAIKIEESGKSSAEIQIDGALNKISSQIISRILFGSSYEKGFSIVDKLTRLQKTFSKAIFAGIPGIRYLPIGRIKRAWKLGAEADDIIMEEIKKRVEGDKSRGFGEDILGILLQEVYAEGLPHNFTLQDVVGQCKTLLIAGQETIQLSLTWTMLLLAMNPEWQERVRDEVMHNLTKEDVPDMKMLSKLNNMTMVLKEAMRLYPPVLYTFRQAKEDIELRNGGLKIPKGMTVWIGILGMHEDPDLWDGDEDVCEFKPERFSSGESTRKYSGYIPFGFGARKCPGERLAQMEQMAILSMILRRFVLTTSPNYVHYPKTILSMYPSKGMHLLLSPCMQCL